MACPTRVLDVGSGLGYLMDLFAELLPADTPFDVPEMCITAATTCAMVWSNQVS